MDTAPHSAPQEQNPLSLDLNSDLVVVSSVAVQDDANSETLGHGSPTKKNEPHPRLLVYTRAELLFLRQSPLVKPPPDMPSLKDWFGLVATQYVCSYTYVSQVRRTSS
jgi:hypothetical protein